MHIFGKDQQAFHLSRTRGEKYFSRINAILVAMQLACWLCSMIRIAAKQSDSMHNSLFGNTRLRLKDAYLVQGCYYNVTRSHAFFSDVNYQLSPENVEYFVSRSVINLRYLFALTGVFTVVSTVNKIFFETCTYELRYHFVVFRKDMITTWELLLMILGVVMSFGVDRENQILKDYLQYCNTQTGLSSSSYSSVLPFVELYVSYFVSLGFFVINMIISVFYLAKRNPRKKLLREDELKRQQWEEMVRQYQFPALPPQPPAPGQDSTSMENTPKQQVIYASNTVPVGGPDAAMYPSAMGRRSYGGEWHQTPPGPVPGDMDSMPVDPPQRPSGRAGPDAAATLYASRLPSVRPNPSMPSSPVPAQQQHHQHHHHHQQQQQQLQQSTNGAGSGTAGGRSLTPVGGAPGAASGASRQPHQQPSLPAQQSAGALRPLPDENTGGYLSSGSVEGSGRFELREVNDEDDEPVVGNERGNADSLNVSVNGPGAFGAGQYGRGYASSGSGRHGGQAPPVSSARPEDPPSVLSTPLLATRNAVIPPPPPVGISRGEGGRGVRPSGSKLLAPPSPLNGGDTTADTVHLQPDR